MANTIAYAVGFQKTGERQNGQASRLGHGAAMANANTWRTFTTCYVTKDGSGYVEVSRDGRTMHHFSFGPEDEDTGPRITNDGGYHRTS